MSIIAIDRLPADARVIKFDTRLQARAATADIYTDLVGVYNRKTETLPMNAVRMKVTDQNTAEGRITLVENYKTAGVSGQTQAEGTEEDRTTKTAKTFQNTWRKVVSKPGYGLRELEASNYDLYDKLEQPLGDWRKEDKGIEIRRALLQNVSSNLVGGDIGLSYSWNDNVFIPCVDFGDQPEQNANVATHTNNICEALEASGGFGQFTYRTLTATVLEDISNYALRKRIRPLKIPGLPTGEGFLLTVSEIQASYLTNPVWTSNNLGSLWKDITKLSGDVQKWSGVIGSYNNLLIGVDPRIPTVTPSGSSAPYSLTAGYMVWDSTDLRGRDNANVKDVAILHGAGAIYEVEGEREHWITDMRDYGLHKGLGIAGVGGFGTPRFLAADDADGSETVQQTSMIILLDMPNGGRLSSIA